MKASHIVNGRTLAVAAVVAGALAAGSVLHATPTRSMPASGFQHQGFADLVDKVKPAVVNISTKTVVKNSPPALSLPPGSPFERQFREFFGQQNRPDQQTLGMGSGFIVDPAGFVVTNNHVINDASDIAVTLHDGTRLSATLVGRDEKTDLALLKVDSSTPLTSVQFGDSDSARVGDWVLAVGNPFGLGGSVTAGIISARGRDIHSGPFDDFLQVDAPINRGNSGGPLFDHSGNVIGVNTAIFSPTGGSVGIGFAIPSEMAAKVVDQLKAQGKVTRGFIGVSIQEVTTDLAESFRMKEATGALVASVGDDTPAARAGLSAGDVIMEFGGERIESMRELPRVVAGTTAGKRVPVTVWRDGRERTLQLQVGRMPTQDEPPRLASAGTASPAQSGRLGVALAQLDEASKREAGMSRNEPGVLVSEVAPGGPAASRGVRAGDVILRVGTTPVNAPSEVAAAVRDAEKQEQDRVVLLVRRDGNERFVAVPFDRG